MNQKQRKKLQSGLVLAVNAVLILALVLVFAVYDNDYKQKLFDQNVDDISNINQSTANISSSYFSGCESKLRDFALAAEQNKLSVADILDFIGNNNSDVSKVFEIIGGDYRGWCISNKDADGNYYPLDYTYGYGDLCDIFNANTPESDCRDIRVSSEFTDGCTAMKSFALYSYLHIADENGVMQPYTLMIVIKSSDYANLINIDSGYDEMSTVLINASGDYIIGSSEYKSTNFFKYLYEFNGLTLDQRRTIERKMLGSGRGSLQYLDGRGRKCVFVYSKVPDKDWYCVTSVPIELFHNRSFDITYTVLVIVTLLFLLAVDFLYLYSLNRRLRVSAENERIASAAKTDFLSRMSHDIRTPLNVIIGMALLARDEQNPPETQKCLDNIDESGKFLLGLVNDILDLNKVEAGKMELHPEPYCYSEFCRHIRGVVEPLCQSKNITFEIKGNMPADRYVMLDRLRVNQIFFNLMSNAVKFTPEGGRIELVCNASLTPDNKVAFDFEVRDNGIGMSKAFQARMFEAFSQETRKETAAIQGTGLGLAIVKNLVTLMDGTLRVESEPDKGTVFYVHIVTTYATAGETKAVENISDDFLSGKHILLCEDHPLNTQIATRVLEKRNMIVEHAENGEVGLQMFERALPFHYDAILMDIRMPVMDGLAATKAIRALARSDAKVIPIIAMTANAYDIDKQNSFEAGMNAHIAKPIDTKVLYETLAEEILKEKTGMNAKKER